VFEKQKKTCEYINKVVTEINNVKINTKYFINESINTNLIPEKEHIRKSRSKRSLLPCIGSLSKSLFNTATMDDVNLLAKHINVLNRLNRKLVASVHHHEDHLASYMQTANNRMSNLMSGMKENEVTITHILSQLYDSFDDLEKTFSSVCKNSTDK
jgi:hypothetical protein